MKILWQVCFGVGCIFLMLCKIGAQQTGASTSTPEASRCTGRLLEPGAGGDIEKIVRSLNVDLNHGVSMIYFPGHNVEPSYAVSLAHGKNWLLTYSVEKATFWPGARAYHATVPLSISYDDLALRIEKVWARAVTSASVANVKYNESSRCIAVDGAGYVFSSNGHLAHVTDSIGDVPAQLFEISDTLRIWAMDIKNTGYPVGSAFDRLIRQLDRIEADLKINSH